MCSQEWPPYRPYINPNAHVDEHLVTLMQECWDEDPRLRLDFNGIAILFTRYGKYKYDPVAFFVCASGCVVECRICSLKVFESRPALLRTEVYSAFHPSGVGE